MIVTINVEYQNQIGEKVMGAVVDDGTSLKYLMSYRNIVPKNSNTEKALVIKLRQVYSCVPLSGKQS